jgi:hypothetical protein
MEFPLEKGEVAMSIPKCISRPPLVAVGLVLMLALLSGPPSLTAQTIPSDAVAPSQDPCALTSAQFAGWFQSGTPSLNGVVKPADSLNFIDHPNCPFYQWGQQMFLWLTSPAPATYCGGGAHVFDSPAFFDVSPPDSGGNRTFISHTCSPLGGVNRILNLRAAQAGAHGLPTIIDKAGRMLEVETPPTGPTGKPLVFSPSGVAIEVQSLTLGKQGQPILLDKAGKLISGARPILQTKLLPTPSNKPLIVQKFMVGGRPVFFDPFGNVVEVEQGQANTGGVLMAQTGSLIYYAIMVNDVYAYLLTGLNNHQINLTFPGQFPTTPADLAQITAFAAAHGVTFPDPNALAVEVKTSWVEASSLPDPSSYITMAATIPTYPPLTSSTTQWTPNGSKTVQLALVGMHVVGSTGTQGSANGPGHPEMIWATFEHVGNTPLASYTYNSTTGFKTVNQSTAGTWLFSKNNSTAPFNCMHMMESGGSIVLPGAAAPCPAGSFTASDTLRDQPFGAAQGVSPNPIDNSDTESNSVVLSANQLVSSKMPPGDVRGNYYVAGATWTIFGGPPAATNQVGTSVLAGSTMETYTQPSNCFGCHNNATTGPSAHGQAATSVSHIFDVLQSLSFAQLSVHVSALQGTPVAHKILVTVTNSGTGAPIAGARVTVDGQGAIMSGTTAANGTVTLSYAGCFIVIQVGLKPRAVHVPCDGSVQATGFGSVGFSAP